MRWYALVAATLMVALGSVLDAGAGPVDQFTYVQRDQLRIAVKHWGPPPCPDGAAYRMVSNAEAHRRTGDESAYAFAASEKNQGYCELGLTRTLVEDFTYAEVCHVVVHEVGHMDGRGHSGDPMDVMYAGFADYTFRPCLRRQAQLQRACDRKRTERAILRCWRRWQLG